LVGKSETVSIARRSLAHRAYERNSATEQFLCNYGLNPNYRTRIATAGLAITGSNREGETRIAERTDHPFFIGTLFLPQFSSTPESPHPLIVAFVGAAAHFQQA